MQSTSHLTRRHFALALAAPALIGSAKAWAAEPVIVETANGRLRGLQDAGVVSFKGVPYAADTGGANRFMAPRPVRNWTGVRDALAFGDRAPQAGRGGEARTNNPAATGPRESENCCVLNVYTPDLNANARRPVMVWIHGGGFRSGAGDLPMYDGQNLARSSDVVVVTVNHRLNLFGYLPLGHVHPAFADAGNAGQLDLVAALKWVQANIRAFGGDPGNVTIFGQSGGGSKVQTLLIMPAAEGLFHKAINMSGPTFYDLQPSAVWEPLSNEFLKNLGIGRGDIRKLQSIPPEQLFAAHGAAVQKLKTDDFRPVIDGRNIPVGPMTPQGLTMKPSVPLLVGTTDTEASSFLRAEPRNATITEQQALARIVAQFGVDEAKAAALMTGYRQNPQNQTPWEVLLGVASDTVFRGRMLLAVEALSAARAKPLWLYNFVWRDPADGGAWGAPHASDIPFAFRNLQTTRNSARSDAGAARASAAMAAAFVAFARSGDPANPLMPEWPRFDARRRATMTIGPQCQVIDDYRGPDRLASRAFLEQDSFQLLAGPLFRYTA